MKLNWKREIFPLTILVTMVAVAIYYYPLLPNVVPSHFDIHGRPDRWMAKTADMLIMGGTLIFIYLLLTFLPFIDPLKRKIEIKFKTILLLRDVVLVFSAVVFSLSLKAAHDGFLSVNLSGIALGVLFIVIGNYLPKIPQNWFVGIRTPWTISSETVWRKTHILGGWLFVLSGIVYIFCVTLKATSRIALLAVILIPAVISVLYSFFLYKKIQKTGNVV